MASNLSRGREMTPWTKPLALVAITGLVSFALVSGNSDTSLATGCPAVEAPTGSGTASDPYVIDSAATLAWVSGVDLDSEPDGQVDSAGEEVDLDARMAAHYLQSGNVDLKERNDAGCVWLPIGLLKDLTASSVAFSGVYDGGSFSISSFETTDLSLFDGIEGVDADTVAEVKNLTIQDAQATDFTNRGVLGVEARSHSLIDNVHITADITLGGNDVGGFFEFVEDNAILQNSSAAVDISTTDGSNRQDIGGLVSVLKNTAQILSSSATGSFSGINNRAGGLVGVMADSGTVISQSWSSVTIQASGGLIGGLVGEMDGEVRYSYATGNVTSSGSDEVGGLVGDMDNSASTISDSFARGQVTVGGSSFRAGGLVGNIDKLDRTVERSFSTRAPQVPDGVSLSANMGAFAGGTGFYDDDLGARVAEPLSALTKVTANYFDTSSSGSLLGVANTTDVDASAAAGKVTGLGTAGMTSYSTYRGAGWAIVDGWAEFSGPDSGDPDPDSHNVWGICSGVNDGYPFLLWQYDSNPCTATAAAESSGRSMDERVDDAGIHLDVQGVVGEQVAGSPVVIGGQGLAAGSAYTLVLRSTPQVIESGVANAAGNFSKKVVMPAGVAPGAHSVTLTAIGVDGSTLSLVTSFVVSPSGVFSSVSPNVATATAGLAATGPADDLWLWGGGFMALLLAGVALTIARVRMRSGQGL